MHGNARLEEKWLRSYYYQGRECDRYRVCLLPDSRSVHLMQALAPLVGGSPRRRYHYLDNAWSWLWSFMSERVGYTDATHTAETDLRL